MNIEIIWGIPSMGTHEIIADSVEETKMAAELMSQMKQVGEIDMTKKANTLAVTKGRTMIRILKLIVITAMLCLTTGQAHSQGAGIEWETLNQEAMKLYRTGQYEHAVRVAEAALNVAEQNVGPDHPDVAQSLNNLALLYDIQGDYAKAEPLYKRSLAISEKALGPEHPDVATSMENMALMYRKMKRDEEAVVLERRAACIRAIQR